MNREQGLVPSPDGENRVRPFSNIIPRRRNRSGEPIHRRFVWTRPLVALEADALVQTAAACATDPVEGRKRLPWLKALNAIAASENAVMLRQELEAGMARENAEAQARISELQPALRAADDEMRRLTDDLESVAAPLGLRSALERADLDFAEDEPASLEELAGKYNLAPPEEHAGWAYRVGYKLLAGIGGETVFGISLGLLTGKLELLSLSEEWPMLVLWSGLGAIVMTLVGACLFPLAKELGDRSDRLGRRMPWLAGLQAVFTLVFLVGLAVAMIRIESKVEQLGLFKAIGEQSSLTGFHVAQADLGWVSLMLVIPTVCSYIVLGLKEGERLSKLAHLKALRQHHRERLCALPAYAKACSLRRQVQGARECQAKLEAEVQALKNRMRTGFTTEEKERLEDMEMDAAAASWDAEDAMLNGARPWDVGPAIGFWRILAAFWKLGRGTRRRDWSQG